MGWLRLRTMLRYRHRLGFMTYFLLLLLVLVVWTYHGRAGRSLDKMLEHHPLHEAQHIHLRNEEIKPRYDDILVVRGTRNKLVESAVFSQKVYASNHSHPVKPVPPVADIPVTQKGLETPCKTVRMVEFFGQKLTLSGDPLCQWLDSTTMMADNRFVLYANKMALLYDVIVDPDARQTGPKGGEKMEEVWGQDEQSEYLHLKDGFFTLQCKSKPSAHFAVPKDHLNEWLASVQCVDNTTTAVKTDPLNTVRGLTIAVQRYEYVNLYHTMTDFFNAFLTMIMFNQHPDDVTILWVDAHPQGGLDDVWDTLFGKVIRAGRLPSKTRFNSMAWAAMGYNSPLNEHSRPSVSYLEEFRHFFLSRYGVDGTRKANCSSLNFLFIWRRDYTAHPRNKGGSISRKVDNEDQLMNAVRDVIAPGDNLHGLQLDALSMQEQLQLIAGTDVLVGMHGAGLSHTLFLPPHGGLLELYPTYWPQANRHFRAMAGWRGLHYQTWQNHDSRNEKENHRTYIPPEVVVKMVKEIRKNICG
ncbi:uncharacterized protein [Littorina saxatilis]|uniref:uncharacterized protein n=1 Tax=Littorina saxatilis TaxID=31220 RepID=UPI0038B4B089